MPITIIQHPPTEAHPSPEYTSFQKWKSQVLQRVPFLFADNTEINLDEESKYTMLVLKLGAGADFADDSQLEALFNAFNTAVQGLIDTAVLPAGFLENIALPLRIITPLIPDSVKRDGYDYRLFLSGDVRIGGEEKRATP